MIIHRNFLTTIKFVDENIEEIENKIKEYYNDDGKTTFLVTSDHGMTDWGNAFFKYNFIFVYLCVDSCV